MSSPTPRFMDLDYEIELPTMEVGKVEPPPEMMAEFAASMASADYSMMSAPQTPPMSVALPATTTPVQPRSYARSKKSVATLNAPQAGELNGFMESTNFILLGHDGKKHYIYNCNKQTLTGYRTNELTDSVLCELDSPEWWDGNFPAPGGKGGYDRRRALRWLFEISHSRGYFNLDSCRGRGAWLDRGRIVFHLGDCLMVNGEVMPLSHLKDAEFVYQLNKRLCDIPDQQLTAAEGKRIAEIADLFGWEEAVSGALLAGWCFLAPICGALSWRPHIWIHGGSGSGKSTILQKFTYKLVPKSNCVFALGGSSEAGIRQSLQSEGLPLLMDEMESDDPKMKATLTTILELLRNSSSDSGGSILRGTVSGEAQTFRIRSMACLNSIGVGIEQKQDLDRIEQLALVSSTRHKREHWEENIIPAMRWLDNDKTLPARMMRRAINMVKVINETIALFSREASFVLGGNRHGDQIGTLLGGWWCLQHDRVPTLEQVQSVLNAHDWSERNATHASSEQNVIEAILETVISTNGAGGGRNSLGGLMLQAAGKVIPEGYANEKQSMKSAADDLALHGIKVDIDEQKVLFHPRNRELGAALKGSKIESGLSGRLKGIPGAVPTGKSRRIGAASTTGILIPFEVMFKGLD